MENRFCKLGKALLGVVCLLSAGGVTYSCSDDFDLDETSPSFLGPSIYDALKNDGNFTTVVKLIDDLDYTDVMQKTGSKTLFAAPDTAFATFFANTTWKDGSGNYVRSYDQLSTSQKKLLFNGSQLNNAYVLETMTTIQGPVKNLCLRQIAGTAATDSIPYFKWDELPENLNAGQVQTDGTIKNADHRFWDRFRTQAYGGMYLALDGTEPMLTHFLEAQLNEKSIKHSDISFVLNLRDGDSDYWKDTDTENRSYAYNARVIKGDVTCLNGYYHVIDRVLQTPQNMAEMIRTNDDTQLFSLLLDRFSAPYYDATLTEEYKALHNIAADSVFKKIYIAQRSSMGTITEDPDGEVLSDFPSLSYDPGWNQYTVSSLTKEQDMAAMFVPNDAAMQKYFLEGAGRILMNRYATKTNNLENLRENLYQIPLNAIKPLIANLMKDSFNESVPSKRLTIMNDASDAMFQDYQTDKSYRDLIEKTLLANNGVVYVMNSVIAPATYSSVMAPALYVAGGEVMNTIIHADDNYVNTNYTNAPLRKFYSTYLLAMQSNFTLFIPTDDGLVNHGYFDPIYNYNVLPNASTRMNYWTFEPATTSATGRVVAVSAQAYRYSTPSQDIQGKTGRSQGATVRSAANNAVTSSWGLLKKQMLMDMMDQHIIVHDQGADGEKGIATSEDEQYQRYFIARSGAPVYIKDRKSKTYGSGMLVDGGLQLQFASDTITGNDFDCQVIENGKYDMTRTTNGYGNGTAYFIDRPIQATQLNCYQVMQQKSRNNGPFSKFFALVTSCTSSNSAFTTYLEKLFKTEDMTTTEWSDEQNKYIILSNSSERYTAQNSSLVRFFNNYRYTVYVPNNDAMEAALNAGLPTITLDANHPENYIGTYVTNYEEELAKSTDASLTEDERAEHAQAAADYKAKAQAMIVCLVNFVKYHFCDQSLFVDNVTNTTSQQSACTDAAGNYIMVTATQSNGALALQDKTTRDIKVSGEKNLLARDFELDAEPTSAYSISASSYVVLHELPTFLVYDANMYDQNGVHFNKAWASAARAKSFMKRFPLRK